MTIAKLLQMHSKWKKKKMTPNVTVFWLCNTRKPNNNIYKIVILRSTKKKRTELCINYSANFNNSKLKKKCKQQKPLLEQATSPTSKCTNTRTYILCSTARVSSSQYTLYIQSKYSIPASIFNYWPAVAIVFFVVV